METIRRRIFSPNQCTTRFFRMQDFFNFFFQQLKNNRIDIDIF